MLKLENIMIMVLEYYKFMHSMLLSSCIITIYNYSNSTIILMSNDIKYYIVNYLNQLILYTVLVFHFYSQYEIGKE